MVTLSWRQRLLLLHIIVLMHRFHVEHAAIVNVRVSSILPVWHGLEMVCSGQSVTFDLEGIAFQNTATNSLRNFVR